MVSSMASQPQIGTFVPLSRTDWRARGEKEDSAEKFDAPQLLRVSGIRSRCGAFARLLYLDGKATRVSGA
jgi:hypothetical protein